MKTIVGLIGRNLRAALRALGREAKRDDGVVALVIAIALIAAAAALIAGTARQNKDAEVRRMSGNAVSVKLLRQSAIAYFLGGNNRLPCPDSAVPPTGSVGSETDGACDDTVGVVPWLTLGLSQDDVIDSYGNYFTYVVTAGADSRAVCKTITNEYNNSSEFTGTINDVTDTESLLTSQDTGDGAAFYYAFISHGPNGLGAISRGGTLRSAPTSAQENQNCVGANSNCDDPVIDDLGTIYTGPKNTASSSAYFDDTVYLGLRSELTQMCEDKTPAQKPNAFVNESFDSTPVGSLPSSLTDESDSANSGAGDGTVQVAAGTGTDRVLEFNGGSTNVDTAFVRAADNLNPAERPLYISFEWTPTVLQGGEAGISVATRATLGDRDANTANNEDLFNGTTDDGLTIRFYLDGNDANGSDTHRIYICDEDTIACDDGTNMAASASTFTLTQNRPYNIEVYDDGAQVWARITDTVTAATASVSLTNIALSNQDLGGSNSVFLINHIQSNSQVDNLLIGRGAMALETSGGSDYAAAAAAEFDLPSPGDLTLEASINPDTLPTGSAQAAVISKWYTDGTTSGASPNSAYRMFLSSSGLTLSVVGDTDGSGSYDSETFSFGYKPPTDKWTHVAIVYNHTAQTASLYIDGELSSTLRSTSFGTNGVIHTATAAPLTIGNERSTASATGTRGFDGAIADVRVWSSARTSAQIFANYKRRVQLTSGLSGLVGNLTFDRDSFTAFGDATTSFTPAGSATTDASLVNSPALVGILQTFFAPFADEFCGADVSGTPGRIVNTYQCDFRDAVNDSGDITIPSNLGAIFVKAWGGGGGGYDSSTQETSGGAGGFSAGRLRQLGSTPISIAGLTLTASTGGGGGGSTGSNNGAGGGGASGLWQDNSPGTSFAGIVAGGGGGGSYGDDGLGQGVNCTVAGDCGPPTGGGGPFNFTALSTHQTARAEDSNDNTCGGRGGDNGPFGSLPPETGSGDNCENGGTDPSATNGGGGAGAAGGVSALGAGGAGFNGSGLEIGAGGGGGGASILDMTAGGGEAGGFDAAAGLITTGADGNGSGFGGGGGSGFAHTSSQGVLGATGGIPTAVGTTDPDYAPSYCASGTNCPVTAGTGGSPNGTAASSVPAGTQGIVVLKW